MTWSILVDKREKVEPKHLFTPFTKKEWDRYPFASEEKLQWFRDAKLGLFIHVGLAAMGKVDIGWSRYSHKMPDGFCNGHILDDVYDGFAKELKFEEFDAMEWIKIAKSAGMKYVVFITKHHDGFHMWDTNCSEHKITKSPFARDYLKELTDACHELDMPIGFYYSQRDWYHPDYEPVSKEIAYQIDKPPYIKYKDGCALNITEKHKKYIDYMHQSIRELMGNYGKIDIFWWDASWHGGMFEADMWAAADIEKEIREMQPHIIINNRASLPGDFDTPERRVGFFQNYRPWETCSILGQAWSCTGEEIRPFKVIIDEFISSICGDGNYLLSIGCLPSGKFAEAESGGLLKIGEWLAQYGSSIYGTRGGPYLPACWGGSTFKDNKVFLHILDLSMSNTIKVPRLVGSVEKVTCLTGEAVNFKEDDNFYYFYIENTLSDFLDIIIALEMSTPVSMEIIDIFDENCNFDSQPKIYGNVLIKETYIECKTVYDVESFDKITGIYIEKGIGNVTVFITDVKDNTECITENNYDEKLLALELSDVVSGASVCGKKLKRIGLQLDDSISIDTCKIYGF